MDRKHFCHRGYGIKAFLSFHFLCLFFISECVHTTRIKPVFVDIMVRIPGVYDTILCKINQGGILPRTKKGEVVKKVLLSACFWAIITMFPSFGALRDVEELSVYYKKEILDGKTFAYREDLANGVKKQVWSIDGKPVEFEEYEEVILDAEKEIRRRERRARDERRRAAQDSRLQAVVELHKKLLRLLVEDVEAALAKFDDHRLMPFLVFDKDSLLSHKEFETIEGELLQEAKKVLYEEVQDGDKTSLAATIQKLDGLPERLQELFQKTVDNAIKRCDDTKMLKELLGVLSSEQ